MNTVHKGSIRQKRRLIEFVLASIFAKSAVLLAQLILPLYVGVEGLGYLRVSQSFIEVLYVVGTLGFTSSMFFTSYRAGASRKDELISAVGVVLIFSLFLIIASNLILESLLKPKVYDFFRILSFLILLNSLNNILTTYYQIEQRFKLISQTILASRSIAILVFFFLLDEFGINAFFAFLYISFGISVVIYLCSFSVRKIISFWHLKNVEIFIKNNISHALYSLGGNLLNVLNKYIGIIIIGLSEVNDYEFGLYSIAILFVLVFDNLTTVVQQYYTPKVATLSCNKLKFLKAITKIEYSLLTTGLVAGLILISVVHLTQDMIGVDFNELIKS